MGRGGDGGVGRVVIVGICRYGSGADSAARGWVGGRAARVVAVGRRHGEDMVI